MKTRTQKELDAEIKKLEKIDSAKNRQATYVENLDVEISELEEQHRQASLDAALAGLTAPHTPARIIQARQELETGNAVLADLRERCEEARQAVADAEQEHTAARRMAITAKLEEAAQEHFKTLAEAYVKLIEVAGTEGWHAVKNLVNYTTLFPDRDPVTRALAAEGLAPGKGSDFSVLPDGAFVMDWTDRAFEAHNGEPAPVEKTCRI